MYTKTQKLGRQGRIYAEIMSDTKPETLPATTDEVPDIPNGYQFEPGSWLYIVQSGERYEIREDGTWVKRPGTSNSSGGASGGSGGGSGDSTPDDPSDDVNVATDDEVQNVIDDIGGSSSGGSSGSGGSGSGEGSGDSSGSNIASDDEVNGVVDDIWSGTP